MPKTQWKLGTAGHESAANGSRSAAVRICVDTCELLIGPFTAFFVLYRVFNVGFS